MIHPLIRKLSLFIFLFQIFARCTLHADAPYILVSVAPHKFFVEKIAKDTVHVQVLVPAGASAHTYEPTQRQMTNVNKADIWFRIGEPFENRAAQAFRSHYPTLEIVNLQKDLDLISTNEDEKSHCTCCSESIDLHFWLSARQAQIQAKTIADTLCSKYPGHKNFYQNNLLVFQQELKDLDEKIKIILSPLQNCNIFVSHPAYAYFCRDYGLKQYPIEIEGKDPTPQQMTKLLNIARQLNLRTIYIQKQYNNKGAKLVADALGGHLITLDPYSEHYVDSMLEIADAFAEQQ
jgi:zinc transport system substrate-binding protein